MRSLNRDRARPRRAWVACEHPCQANRGKPVRSLRMHDRPERSFLEGLRQPVITAECCASNRHKMVMTACDDRAQVNL
ncbi:hypothetical protein C4K23_4508 [Pseudomonas chlororaphis]|nr:hypothetical protein C4K23_4508 [Pseudomonas chlororaphis]